MFEINTQIEIDSPIESVWSCLMDTAKYPSWNSFIRKVEGKFSEGNRLTVEISPPGDKPMKFFPVCLAVKKNSELRWVGNLGYDWIFRGEHYFVLEKTHDQKTKLIHGEKFSGIICWIFKKLKGDVTKKGFEAMNQNLSDYLAKSSN